MIAVHRITQPDHELYVNPDLIQTIEANPDTVIALTNGSKFVVAETPAEVARLVREWRAGILAVERAPLAPRDRSVALAASPPSVDDAPRHWLRD